MFLLLNHLIFWCVFFLHSFVSTGKLNNSMLNFKCKKSNYMQNISLTVYYIKFIDLLIACRALNNKILFKNIQSLSHIWMWVPYDLNKKKYVFELLKKNIRINDCKTRWKKSDNLKMKILFIVWPQYNLRCFKGGAHENLINKSNWSFWY